MDDGWIVLLALIPIALFVLLIVNIGKMNSLRNEMRSMRTHMRELAGILAERPARTSPDAPVAAPAAAAATPTPATATAAAPATPATATATTPTPTPAHLPPPLPVRDLHEDVRIAAEEQARVAAFVAPRVVPQPPVVPPPPPAPPRPSFLERNPDLEKFIGENLINKIGIAIFVVGMGMLLKFSIGKGWLSESAQILIGIASGALLLFFAHRLRETFRAFSSVLVGGGLSVLYFSIYIAFQQYHLFGQTAAFCIMVGITAIGILLTLVYDRKELAVIALLGGFASPFMASNDAGDFKVLFTYVLILDTGMLVLANFKKWHILNVISFVLTALLFGGWLGMRYPELDPRPVWPALLFATGFFGVFFSMNLRYNLRHNTTFGPLDFSLLLINTAAYYGAGMTILDDLPLRINGLFTIALALFHLVFAVLFFKRANAPRYLVFLLIGLVLTLISLAAPVQLHGNYITLFWSAECALLMWFSQRTGIRLVERASVLVMLLMLISLVMDFAQHYGVYPLVHLRPVINKPWITGMVASIALGIYAKLCEKLPAERDVVPGISPKALRNTAWTLCGAVLFFTNFLELAHQLGYLFDASVVTMALATYTLAALVVACFLTRNAGAGARWSVLALVALTLLFHITSFYNSSRSALLDHRLATGGAGFGAFHIAAFVAALLVLWCASRSVRSLVTRPSGEWSFYLWCMCIYLVFFFSQELDHALLLVVKPLPFDAGAEAADPGMQRYALEGALNEARKGAYPILWGIGSFVGMWYGMRTRQRMVRIIALSLFAVTLLKLFLFDLSGISEGGKVAAFICLGILLLVVSFMYNKLKGLLKDDDRLAAPSDHGPMPPPLP